MWHEWAEPRRTRHSCALQSFSHCSVGGFVGADLLRRESGIEAESFCRYHAFRVSRSLGRFAGDDIEQAAYGRSTLAGRFQDRGIYCKRHLRRCRCSSGRMANSLLTLSSATKAWLWPRSTCLIAPCGSETRGVATNSRLTSRLRAHKRAS